MTGYKALVVDFGGVLTTPLQEAMFRFAEQAGVELQDLARAALGGYMGSQDSLVFGFETGAIPEDEFTKAFAERLREESGIAVDPDTLIQKLFGGLELEESMFTAVERARAHGLKTGLLSNSWGTSLYPRDRLDPIFDVMVISGEVGLRKPDPAIFTLTTARLGLPAEACVFVDDLGGNLKPAKALGMATVRHTSARETIPQLEELLGVTLR